MNWFDMLTIMITVGFFSGMTQIRIKNRTAEIIAEIKKGRGVK